VKVLIPLMVLFSMSSYGTVTVGAESCPTDFEGRVKEIIPAVGADHAYALQKVIFTKDGADEEVQLDMLSHGTFSVERDKDYHVQMRAGKLCWLEQI
jgi:hypothetical protein